MPAAASATSTLKAVTGRRSLWNAMRMAARTFESHPQPVFSKYGTQKGDWGRAIKPRVQAMGIYLPFMGFVLGWPVLARELLNGHM